MDNVLLSKIVANPTTTTWSQAYSTLNFYLVLSIKAEETKEDIEIAAEGKELFEQVQREYFALDEKDLNSIKKAVESALEKTSTSGETSLVLATIKDDVLYLVLAGSGEVIIKRGDSVGAVAKGENDKITAFSGKLVKNDIITIETGDFSKKIPVSKLSEKLNHPTVNEIAEELAPEIHENPIGTEAAIILEYKEAAGVSKAAAAEAEEPEESEGKKPSGKEAEEADSQDNDTLDLDDDKEKNKKALPAALGNLFAKVSRLRNFSLNDFKKKKVILISILILLVVLILSIGYQKIRQDRLAQEQAYAELIAPIQEDYDEAIALESLNKGLALEEFESVKERLEVARSNFKENSPELKKIDEFIGMVEKKIGELGSGSTVSNEQTVFDAREHDIKNIHLLSFKDEDLIAINKDNGSIVVLSSNGEIANNIEVDTDEIIAVSSDDSFIYIFAESVLKIDKNNGNSIEIISTIPSNAISVDNFLGNVYILSTGGEYVYKYASSAFAQDEYFTEDVVFSSDPTSFSIDGSIWIVANDGQIREFNRGAERSFSVNNLTKKVGASSQIYTDIDYENIYILDKANSRIISIGKDGEYQNQYVWKVLGSASDFAIDEPGNKAYVLIDNKIHSFDL